MLCSVVTCYIVLLNFVQQCYRLWCVLDAVQFCYMLPSVITCCAVLLHDVKCYLVLLPDVQCCYLLPRVITCGAVLLHVALCY